MQALFEISQDLGTSLSLDETLSVLGMRLRKIIPHSALAIWIKRDHVCFRNMSMARITGCSLHWRFPWDKAFPDGSRRTASRF